MDEFIQYLQDGGYALQVIEGNDCASLDVHLNGEYVGRCTNLNMIENVVGKKREITKHAQWDDPIIEEIMEEIPPGTYTGKVISADPETGWVRCEITEGPYKGKII